MSSCTSTRSNYFRTLCESLNNLINYLSPKKELNYIAGVLANKFKTRGVYWLSSKRVVVPDSHNWSLAKAVK